MSFHVWLGVVMLVSGSAEERWPMDLSWLRATCLDISLEKLVAKGSEPDKCWILYGAFAALNAVLYAEKPSSFTVDLLSLSHHDETLQLRATLNPEPACARSPRHPNHYPFQSYRHWSRSTC